MLGNRLKELREKSGKSQQEVCSALNIEQSTLANYENGKRTPKIDIIMKLAAFYNVSIDYLVGLERAASLQPRAPGNSYSNISECIKLLDGDYAEIAATIGVSKEEFLDCKDNLAHLPYSALERLAELSNSSTDYIIGLRSKSRDKGEDGRYPFIYNEEIGRRIKRFCDEKKYRNEDLERYLCLASDEVYYLTEYGFVPHVDTIIKLAELFDTTSDYLLCLIDEQTDKAIRSFRLMNEDSKDIVVGKIKEVLREQRHEQLYDGSVAADKPLKQAK